YLEAWKVWIDWNGDGDFKDAGEMVFARKSRYQIRKSIYVPYSAAVGKTRMRVAMRYWKFPNGPCAKFDYGEVEDYTIDIVGSEACELVNLALDKPTEQSSKSHGGKSERAVDGNTNGKFKNKSVTHTKFEFQPWWEVDLEERTEIDNVVLWNRTDCCKHRLNYFFVMVSEKPFKTDNLYNLLKSKEVKYFYHEGRIDKAITIPVQARGRYVRIQLAGPGVLSLAEVEVNACKEDPRRVRELLAFDVRKSDQEVELEWMSNTGFKNDYFIVERSADGVHFEPLLQQDNEGIEWEARTYHHYDTEPMEGMNYYRLQLVQKDGTVQYTKVHEVKFPLLDDFTIFPNPAGDYIHLDLSRYQKNGRAVDINMYNELGHRVYQEHLPEVSSRLHRIDLRSYTNGIYYIHIDAGVKPIGKKLVITRTY
ncbi:MAG: GEVED domain-containing protein, partial [Bacteroidota bacterium]